MKKPIGHELPDYNLEPSDETVPCPDCNGEGRDADEDGWYKCSRCEGTGKIDYWEYLEARDE